MSKGQLVVPSRIRRRYGIKPGTRRFERTMPLDVLPIDRDAAEFAAHLKTVHGLGLADAFAAAAAIAKRAELVTADTEFKVLEKEIKIVWLA